MRKQTKYKEPIKLDVDLTFEEAMKKIMNTNVTISHWAELPEPPNT